MPIADLHFTPDHPAFAGHFPGQPIVPGVLLLEGVQRTVEAATGLALDGLAVAKFLSPAQPGDALALAYDVAGSAVRFEIRCGVRKIANGRFLVESGSAQ